MHKQQKATLKTLEPKEAKHAKLTGPKHADVPEIDDYERPDLEKYEKPEFGKADKLKKVRLRIQFVLLCTKNASHQNAIIRILIAPVSL